MKILNGLIALYSQQQTQGPDSRDCLVSAGNWLLQAQAAGGGGGYAHSYSFLEGWRPAYPETTGYLIETLVRLGEFLGNPAYRESALKAGEWLLKIQNKDGSYADLSGEPRIFDTAQILRGLLTCERLTQDKRYLDAATRAGAWLIQYQEADGSFIRWAYLNVPHSYYIKVAAPLLDLGERCNDVRFRTAAENHIAWVLQRQRPNGFFDQAGFSPNDAPFSHTILYVLEGLMESRARLRSRELNLPIEKLSRALLAADQRDQLLASRYDEAWRPALRQYCLPGLAQWANAAFELHQAGAGEDYLKAAQKTLSYLKAKQIHHGDNAIRGGLSGSVPLWGKYLPFALTNWGIKYFVDALLEEGRV